MSPFTAPLLAALAAVEARVVAVRLETVDDRPAISILTSGSPDEVVVQREGEDVILFLGAALGEDVPLPAAVPPLDAISLERLPNGAAVRIRVAPQVSYEVRREEGVLRVLFGEPAPAPDQRAQVTAEVRALYQKLFPPQAPAPQPPAATQSSSEERAPESTRDDFHVGPLSLRPSVIFVFVDGTGTFLDTPEPVSDRYFLAQPSLGARLTLPTLRIGRLTLAYTPRFRGFTSIAQLRKVTHEATASFVLPVTPGITLSATDRYVKGAAETSEVDPGGEYFFGLGRFRRNEVGGSVAIETGGPVSFQFGAAINDLRFEEASSFFSYRTETARATIGYALSALRTEISYVTERLPPPPERPQAESRANSVVLEVSGDVAPLMTARVSAGYRDQKTPAAAQGGTRYRGLVFAAGVTKQFSRALRLSVDGTRATYPSGFEGNAFYVAETLLASLTSPLPYGFTLSGTAGYHWNRYRTVAVGLGEPRQDRLSGWSVGLGHAVTRHAFLRADYRRERRNSNLQAFNIQTHAFVVQFGIGVFGAPADRVSSAQR